MAKLSELLQQQEPEKTSGGNISANEKLNTASYLNMLQQKQPSFFNDRPLPIAGTPARVVGGAAKAVADVPSDLMEGAKGFFQKGLVDPFKKVGGSIQESTSAISEGRFEDLSPTQGAAIPIAIAEGVVNAAFEGIKTAGKIFLTPSQEDSIANGIADASESVADIGIVKSAVEKWNKLPENAKESLEAASYIAEIVTGGLAAKPLKEATKSVVGSVELPALPRFPANSSTTTEISNDLAKSTLPQKNSLAGGIVQRMNRITGKKQEDFAKLAGKEMGEWLAERGIFSAPEETVNILSDRMKQSMAQADAGMDKIPGVYQDKSIDTVLSQLNEIEQSLAKKGGASKDKKAVENLIKRNKQNKGLSMREINQAKRLYERKVKSEYIKDQSKTSDQVQAATNLDTKLRDFQRSKAIENGFDELVEINKETMMSKMAADAIGERYLRAAGNNAVTITDWIAAAPAAANPAALGLLVGKKLASSDLAQSFLAKSLKKGEAVEIPKADIEKIERKAKLLENRINNANTQQEKKRLIKRKEDLDDQIRGAMGYNQLLLKSGEDTIPSGNIVNTNAITGKENSALMDQFTSGSKSDQSKVKPQPESKTQIESSKDIIPKDSTKAKPSAKVGGMNNLETEAKKFKTADEFVEDKHRLVAPAKEVDFAYPREYNREDVVKTMYKSMQNRKDVTMPKGVYVTRGAKGDGTGNWFTPIADKAVTYAKVTPNGKVTSLDISSMKFAPTESYGRKVASGMNAGEVDKMIKRALGDGYDGLYSGGNLLLPTKSQLTDIWNKANKPVNKLETEAKKFKTADEFVESLVGRESGDNKKLNSRIESAIKSSQAANVISKNTGLSIGSKKGKKGMGTEFVFTKDDKEVASVILKENQTHIDLGVIGVKFKSSGTGSDIMMSLKKYSDDNGKILSVVGVTNERGFFDKFKWLSPELNKSNYIYTPRDKLTDIWNKANKK